MIILDGNARRPGLHAVLRGVLAWSAKRAQHLAISSDLVGDDGDKPGDSALDGADYVSIIGSAEDLQTEKFKSLPAPGLVVSLGGDGALLYVIRRYRALGLPFMGVNLGSLGFNAAVSPDRLIEALEAWEAGKSLRVDHLALDIELQRGGKVHKRLTAINDLVVQRELEGKMIDIALHQGSSQVLRYFADGIVVSTPTGSTAYNLSAGGPIVHPELRAIVVSGLAPHTLTPRPIVLPTEPPLELSVGVRHGELRAAAMIDGQERWDLLEGDRLTVSAAPEPIRLVAPADTDYFQTLRSKLNWCAPARPRDT